MNNSNISLTEMLSTTHELSIFKTSAITNFVAFRWNSNGFAQHTFGAIVNLFFVIGLVIYVQHVYINNVPGYIPGV